MLKLYNYIIDNYTAKGQFIAVLERASNIKVTNEINNDYTVEFDFPYGEKSELIKVNYLIDCEGQLYRIMKISQTNDGTNKIHVSCTHIFFADLRSVHIQTIGGDENTIGASPSSVMAIALQNTSFSVLTDAELAKLGLTSVSGNGFLIDLEAVDKTTPYDIILQIIENCGKGELYIDNYKCAIVERLGNDNGVTIDTTINMKDVTIERDISNLITRLYPYGKDDAHIGSVNNNVQYIDSTNINTYGVRAGYKDYSDYDDPTEVFMRGLWEFSTENENRIDVPDVNISGNFIDIARLTGNERMAVNLGDTVHVFDHGEEITERVTRIERYPFEPLETVVSIGRIKKDLFFYLKQLGSKVKRSEHNITAGGKIKARSITGSVTASSAASAKGVKSGKYTISDSNGTCIFDVWDNSGNQAMTISSDGLQLTANSITIGGKVLKVKDGYLYVDNTKLGG